jgi:SAM-dependent methyltransferase
MNDLKGWTHYLQYSEPLELRRVNFIINQVNSFASRVRKPRILDLGCGSGGVSIPLASLGYDVTGVDIDPDAISLARHKNPFRHARFLVHDCTSPSLVSQLEGFYDCILCIEVIEHLVNPTLLLKNVKKLLAREGIAIVTVPNGYEFWQVTVRLLKKIRLYNKLRYLKRRFFDKDSTILPEKTPHIQWFTYGSLQRLFSKMGFIIEKSVNAGTILNIGYFAPFSRGLRPLQHIDLWLGDKLPFGFAAEWFFVLRIAPDERSS